MGALLLKKAERRKIVFRVGEELTAREMAERLGITATTWKNKRKKYMGHLEQFYKIESVGHGVSLRYVIKEQLQEYEPMISPKDKRAMEERYMETILAEISKPHMNLQLYSTMTDRVIATGRVEQFNHKPKTSYKYTNSGMKEMFGADVGDCGTEGRLIGKVWAKRLYDEDYDFEKLTDEQLRDWKYILKERFSSNEYIVNAVSAFMIGESDVEEAKNDIWQDSVFRYQLALEEFENKYGFTPVKVKEYMVYSDKLAEDLANLFGDYENSFMSKEEAIKKMGEIYSAHNCFTFD